MSRLRSTLARLRLPALFSLFVLSVFVLTMVFQLVAMLVFEAAGLIVMGEGDRVPLFAICSVCLWMGLVLSAAFSRRATKPIEDIMDATDKVAAGDYSVRVEPSGSDEMRALGERFNHMAEELGSVEMLRSDFVSTFSHELKTPLASIQGFAEMLRRDDLTDAEREEYLGIIVDETGRLSDLASSVLLLSKVENQAILADAERVDVSEQVRLAIARTAPEWDAKGLDMELEGDEAFVRGSAELLDHVWANLLDNAVKFSPEGGRVTVRVAEAAGSVDVSFENEAPQLTEGQLVHVFERFYQVDESHATPGNGLGLAIARRVTELHGGTVSAMNVGCDRVRFRVVLPAA